MVYKDLYNDLIKKIPINQIDETIKENDIVDISFCSDDPFVGFIDVYYPLSLFLPKESIIIDIGCAYAFQSYYFNEFDKYIGIDLFTNTKIIPENGTFYKVGCRTFINEILPTLNIDKDKVFCICSYVPLLMEDVNLLKNLINL